MSEPPPPLEGWHVPARAPALAMAALLAVLVLALLGGGAWYNAHLAPRTRPNLAAFPSPRLETAQRPPREPMRAGPARPRDIAAAERATIAEGDALWAR